MRHQSTFLCSNVVKFVRREIGEIVHYLFDRQKTKFRLPLKLCRYCVDCAQNVPGPAPINVLKVLKISSKSVYCQRSHSRTSEHRQIAP